MKQYLIILFLLPLMVACNEKDILTDISVDSTTPLISNLIEINDGEFSSLIDSMQLVPLDEEQIVGRIKRIRYANGNFYIVADEKLLLFNENGEFIKVISEKGEGPDEFLYFCDFDVDSTGIVIRDNTKFMFYDTMGNPLRQISHKFGFGSIRLLPEGRWVITTVEPLNNNKRLAVLDNNGDTVFTALDDYAYDHGFYQDLFHLDNDVIMHPMFYHGGNELFVVNTRTKESKYIPVSVDGDPMSCKEFAAYVKTPGELIDAPKITYLGYSDNRSMIFFSAFKQGKKYRYVLDKETGQTLELRSDHLANDLVIEGDKSQMFNSTYFTTSDTDYFVTWLRDPIATYEQSVTLNPRFKAEYTKLAEIDDESNPVLALIKFKSPRKFVNEN